MSSPRTASERLCIRGIEAQFNGQLDVARGLYRASLEAAVDAYDRCVAAHYVAHLEECPIAAHEWNLAALRHACEAEECRVEPFMPSLLANLGRTFEVLGQRQRAAECYAQAQSYGLTHSPDLVDGPWLRRDVAGTAGR